MKPSDIEAALWSSRITATDEAKHDELWWPRTQGEASLWAASFFLTMTRREFDKPAGLSVSVAWNTNLDRKKVLSRLWENDGGEVWLHEALVDFSVHAWDKNEPFKVTGESEMYPYHGVKDSLTTVDDYSWDFFKLLTVPSRLRMFFARVGTQARMDPIKARIEQLESSLKGLVSTFGASLLRPGDRLCAIILSATKEAAADSRVLYLDSGKKLEAKAVNSCPKLWKRDR